ncbi:ATP-binding protein [Okeania sp.]|uniref:ATP-binding protein n=1 Tax=Okeania sp. TaxID=3100323 RepID=UPI002B4B889B|nr:ATP-binding protein [Okeania sp.]MEB3339264.1 ATP-binding protein [Okeania sp.]
MRQRKFFPDEPVEPNYFVGRKSELQTIFNKVNRHGDVAIYGSSGIGKTSLLRYIQSTNFWKEKKLDFSEVFIVYKNCDSLVTSSNFWQEVLTDLKNKVKDDENLQQKIDEV